MLNPPDDIPRFKYLSSWIINICKKYKVDHIFLEGYSYASKGRVFHIGENTGILKYRLNEENIPVTILQPKEIKKYATGKGNANKKKLEESFIDETGFDIKAALGLTEKQDNPSSDIIDSYYILKAGLDIGKF